MISQRRQRLSTGLVISSLAFPPHGALACPPSFFQLKHCLGIKFLATGESSTTLAMTSKFNSIERDAQRHAALRRTAGNRTAVDPHRACTYLAAPAELQEKAEHAAHGCVV